MEIPFHYIHSETSKSSLKARVSRLFVSDVLIQLPVFNKILENNNQNGKLKISRFAPFSLVRNMLLLGAILYYKAQAILIRHP